MNRNPFQFGTGFLGRWLRLREGRARLRGMSHSALGIVFLAPGVVDCVSFTLPEPQPDEVLVRTLWSCISPGTEARCLAGLQAGAPVFPFIPGYSASGVVEISAAGGPAVGTRVFFSGTRQGSIARAWGGHVSHAVLGVDDLVVLPEGLDDRVASGAKLAAIAHRGFRLGRPQVDEAVVVIGLGPIGRLSAEIHAAAGARVVAVDLDARRRKAAAANGLEVVDPGTDLGAALRAVMPDGADIVVDATGAAGLFAAVPSLLREVPWDQRDHRPRRVVIQGSYAKPPMLPYDELFSREAQVLVPRDSNRSDLLAVLEMMAQGRLNLADCVADAGDPRQAPQAVYEALLKGNGQVTAAFNWST